MPTITTSDRVRLHHAEAAAATDPRAPVAIPDDGGLAADVDRPGRTSAAIREFLR